MKRTLLLLTIIIPCTTSIYAYEPENENLLILSDWQEVPQEINGFKALYPGDEWPVDDDGYTKAACILFKFKNLSTTDISDIDFNFGRVSRALKVEERKTPSGTELVVFANPTRSATSISVVQRGYNYHSNTLNQKLEGGHVYEATVTGLVKTPITIDVITEKPTDRIEVKLENGQQARNGVIQDVSLGKHSVEILINGNKPDQIYDKEGKQLSSVFNPEIEVSHASNNLRFTFDVRRRGILKVSSQNAETNLTVDGKLLRSKGSASVSVPFGLHKVEASINGRTDVKMIEVTSKGAVNVEMKPIKYITYKVKTLCNNQPANGSLTINNVNANESPYLGSEGNGYYTLSFPENMSVNLKFAYNGKETTKTFRAKDGNENEIILKVKEKVKRFNSYHFYDRKDWTFEVGATFKDWTIENGGKETKLNRWMEDGKSTLGVRGGFNCRPTWKVVECVRMGFELGLNVEYYHVGKENRAQWAVNEDIVRYDEVDLSAPIHFVLGFAFTHNSGIFFHGGLGLDYAVYGAYGYNHNKYQPEKDVFDNDFYPKKFNYAWEAGVDLRIKALNLSFTYSRGLAPHTVLGNVDAFQNKLVGTIGVAF